MTLNLPILRPRFHCRVKVPQLCCCRAIRVTLASGLAAAGLLFIPNTSVAAIYCYVDAQGTPHFSDRAESPLYQIYMADAAGELPDTTAGAESTLRSNPGLAPGFQRYSALVREAADTFHVETALIHAIISVESAYNPGATSRRGALGLMQIMPATARQYHVSNPLNPRENIFGGTQLLRDLLTQFNNQLDLTLAAYNAGSGVVGRYGRTIPPYTETQNFVPLVLRRYRLLKTEKTEALKVPD